MNSGEWQGHLVHRLVATRFLPNTENKPTVNHRDSNRQNNAADNLEWATYKEQAHHARSTGLATVKRGPQHHMYGTHQSETTKARMASAHVGEGHPKFIGWYITPNGRFASAREGARANDIHHGRLVRNCREGKMVSEGWDFEQAQQAHALAIAA
ncbi:HNH endonuclease [Hymenobacter sp. NBH84]|nr:HNH endonuclease [Hymenobacter sp. NBH84]